MDELDLGIGTAVRLEWMAERGIRIVAKRSSTFMKLLFAVSFMWLWNKRFMDGYATTIGRTIYAPGADRLAFVRGVGGRALLEHELQHIADSERFGRLGWALLYLFPQSLALLAFGALWSPWFLIALITLAPWPAPFRVWAEFRGYREQYKTLVKFGAAPRLARWMESMETAFCGWSYYRMAWRWKPIRKRFWDLFAESISVAPPLGRR